MISRHHRFHGYGSLRFVHRQGRMVRGTAISIKAIQNDRRTSYRAAVVVSRKVSKSAVVRNRIRRRIYEAVRAQEQKIMKPHDIVIMVYSDQVETMAWEKLQATVEDLLRRAGVLDEDKPERAMINK